MKELNYTDNIERDLGMWPSVDESPYLYHFYVYTHMADISGLDLFNQDDLMRVFSERRRYSYYVPRNLDPKNLSESGSTSDIKLSAATVEIRESVISKLRSEFKSQTLESLNEQLFSDDKCSLPAKDTSVLTDILENSDRTNTIRKWFSGKPPKDYPAKLYKLETILYDKENRARRNYFYIPLIRGTYLYGYLVLVFKEVQDGEINCIKEYLRDSVVSKGISFYDRVVKDRYESSDAIKAWLCESISELANYYGMVSITQKGGVPTFCFDDSNSSNCTDDLRKIDFDFFGRSFSLKFELGALGDEFCGIKRYRKLKALPFKLNTFRRAIIILKDDSAYRQKAWSYALHSAIGSIMSRNGSHNIGSHVLSALSHNVGTMPDDRVLYQYIQHRMDYIATVTTELPSWTVSTMFIGEMMRTFLSQHHLLEYIASSEGLKAYKFQDLNIDLGRQSETIQIHVSYGSSLSKLAPVFSFDGKDLEQPIENDVAVAISGGVVGQHAFFTIVENVIRNAAKHGWSSMEKSKRKNLEIHIDVVDDISKDYVTFRIWDNMSSVDIDRQSAKRKAVLKFVRGMENGNGGKRKRLKFENILSTAQTSILIKRYEEESTSGFNGEKIITEEGALPLHWRQQILMDQRIIHPDGSLRRENWGLAEVKISAGYLQHRAVEQMGGLDVLEGEDFIVRAITLRSESEDVWRLGYEFGVPRPRKILILSDTLPKNTSRWKRAGVHFLELSKAKEALEKWRKGEKTDTFSAEYLVVGSACKLLGRANFSEIRENDLAAVPFPFRVLYGDWDRTGNDDLTIVPLIRMENLRSGGNWKSAKDIETCVSTTWMNYCCERRGYDSTSVRIDLNTSGNEGGSGQALISDADIWRLLFTEYFHSTLESFSEENCAEDIKLFRRCLLENRTHYKFFADDPIVVEQLASEKLSIDYFDDNAIVARQFQYLLRSENKMVSDAFPSDKIKHELDVVIGECAAADFAAKFQALYNSYLLDCRPDIDRMIRHFKQAFKQLDVILRKYEERIVTLPQAFSILRDIKEPPLKVVHKDVGGIADKVVMYNRHHKVTEADLDKHLYVEPLSGSQSYLNRLSVYSRDDFIKSEGSKALLRTQLIENALMRILIVDERVSRFLRSHEKSRLIFRAMNIWCLDETGTVTDGSLLQEAEKSKGQLLVMSHNAAMDKDKFTAFLKVVEVAQRSGEKGRFDILIIHLGVLDKWCKDASSVSGMEDVIDRLKRVVDYVVITTGRGTPANIPPCTRILPFSTIESTLFKLYPEKMTLVDSIMNILPLGGVRK